MIACRELIGFLMAYLDDELPATERRRFDEHLAVCPACIAYIKTYTETVRLGKAAWLEGDGSLPPDIPEELVKAILSAREISS